MTPPINIDGTQITGASIDGQDVSEITVDGTQVFSSIPASAVYFWLADDFATPWVDKAENESMAINGLSASSVNGTNSVAGNGSTDFGDANIGTWDPSGNAAIEIVLATTSDGEAFGKRASGSVGSRVVAGIGNTGNANGTTSGVPAAHWRDPNDNRNSVEAQTDVSDGNIHTVIWGKKGDNFQDLFITVDGVDENLTTNFSESDGLVNIGTLDLTNTFFFATNSGGAADEHLDADIIGFALHDAAVTQGTIL